MKLTPEYELHYWIEKMGVSAEVLQEAAARVGDSPDRALFAYLRQRCGG